MNATQTASAVPPDVARAHARLLSRNDLQFDFPALTNPALPHWFQALLKWLGTLKPLLQGAGWIVVACVAGLLIWFAGRRAWRYFRSREGGGGETAQPVTQWRPAPVAAKLLLNDADALAMAGRYGEAAHPLLLRGIQDIAQRNPSLLRPALTSREIAALRQLPQIPRNAFMRIAQIVELALFAERALGADEFSSCRSEYERFAFAPAWSAETAR